MDAILASQNTAKTEEAIFLIGASLLHLPLPPLAPFSPSRCGPARGFPPRVHRRSNLDSVWGKVHMPWHVDHHLAKNQDAN